MPSEHKEQDKFLFSLSAVDIPAAEEGKKRTFQGTAYAGGRVDGHWYWGRTGVVFDLEGIEIKTPTPLLEEHFSTNRIGVVKQVNSDGKIDVSGHFLKNPKALEIIQDSDDEFPFQMSMFIDPGSVEEVLQGQVVNVNGQSFTGPIAVFRNNRIREFTICSTGADRDTSIKAFSGKPNQSTKEDTDVTELEQAQAKIKELEGKNTQLETENKQFAADKREAEIKTLETELKKEFSAEDKTKFSALDDTSFGFMASQLRQFSVPVEQKTPGVNPAFEHLFKHQATGGQGDQQPSGNQHQFTAGAQAFADQNKGA